MTDISILRQELNDVQDDIREHVEAMTVAKTNKDWQHHSDKRYALVKRKRELTDQIIKAGKANIRERKLAR